MTVKRSDLYLASRLNTPLYNANADATVGPATLKSILSKAESGKLGKAGAKAISAAYDAAKAKVGKNPTYNQIRAEVSRAESSLRNEKAKGRINDGYVDDREVAGIKGDVAKAVYAFLGKASKVSKPADANVKATKAQLGKALTRLDNAAEAGFKAFAKINDGNYYQLTAAMRTAAAGLGKDAVATLVIATNGVTGRGDNGSLTDGGNSLPTLAEVKKALKNAATKLASADGAAVVDFANASKAAVVKRDGVITGLEVDRTPLVQGKAAHSFLAYASGL